MTTIINLLAIITLCISDIALGTLVVFSVSFLRKSSGGAGQPGTHKPTESHTEKTGRPDRGSFDEDKRAMEEYIRQEQAFQQLLNFNADKAYGINPDLTSDEEK